jgi:hypothetical protein
MGEDRARPPRAAPLHDRGVERSGGRGRDGGAGDQRPDRHGGQRSTGGQAAPQRRDDGQRGQRRSGRCGQAQYEQSAAQRRGPGERPARLAVDQARQREAPERKARLHQLEQHENGRQRPPPHGRGCRAGEQGGLQQHQRDVAGRGEVEQPGQRAAVEDGTGRGAQLQSSPHRMTAERDGHECHTDREQRPPPAWLGGQRPRSSGRRGQRECGPDLHLRVVAGFGGGPARRRSGGAVGRHLQLAF